LKKVVEENKVESDDELKLSSTKETNILESEESQLPHPTSTLKVRKFPASIPRGKPQAQAKELGVVSNTSVTTSKSANTRSSTGSNMCKPENLVKKCKKVV